MSESTDLMQRQLGCQARTIVIFPGNLGTLTRQPKHNEKERVSEVFERLWHVNDPNFLLIATAVPSRAECVKWIMKYNPAVKALHKRAEKARVPSDVAHVLRDLSDLSIPVEAIRACRTAAYTSVGNAGESVALANYATQMNVCVRQPRHRFTMICLVKPASYLVEIRGRVDGVVRATKLCHPKDEPSAGILLGKESVIFEHEWRSSHIEKVIEAKTRTHGLFRQISYNEQVQLEMYLQLLNVEHGVLVERFNEQIMCHDYTRSNKFYNKIMESLEQFMDIFVKFLNSYAARLKYIALNEEKRTIAICNMIDGKIPDSLFA